MSDNTSNVERLSEQEQQLLCRYCDGELGILERWKVSSLMKRSADARSYVERQHNLCQSLCECLGEDQDPSCSLWQKIADGIEKEERDALLSEEYDHWLQGLFPRKESFVWGMSGACAAACLTLLFLPAMQSPEDQRDLLSSSSVESSSVTSTAGLVPVAHQSSGSLQDTYGSQPVEVDWLRSSGRVKMIAGSGRSAPIMWISRRERTPDPIAAADAPIRMLPDRTPHTFSVSNTR